MKQVLLSVWLLLACLSFGVDAQAEVLRKGVWPKQDSRVTLSLSGTPRNEAVQELAKKAGLSVIFTNPSSDKIDLHVQDEPADQVLELLLSDRKYLVNREGKRIIITPEGPISSPTEEKPQAETSPPKPEAGKQLPPKPTSKTEIKEPAKLAKASTRSKETSKRPKDRVVAGGNVRIDKGKTVKDLVVMGGSADVYGKVEGDVLVMGGSVVLYPGAKVLGDATTFGGSIEVKPGAKIVGDTGAIGGNISRGDESDSNDLHWGSEEDGDRVEASVVERMVSRISGALTRSALLFVFGVVMLALGTRRMEMLQTELASRPMRSFALGLVGLIATALLIVVFAITVIGIPLALIGALLLAFAAYVGIVAVLTTVGGALTRHRSQNPYVHLAVGCALYLVLGSLPFLGGLTTAVVFLAGFGAICATRATGLVRRKREAGPYRTAAS